MRETWLIRHAQSSSNAGQPTEAPATTPLSELGYEQARLLANSMDQEPDLVVTSPYVRSLQTAQPLMDRYPDCTHEEWPVQEFTYLNPACYRGTTAAERRPRVNAYWEALAPRHEDGPGAESFVAFMDRVHVFMERAKTCDGVTLVVSHGQFIRGCIWRLLVAPSNEEINEDEAMANFRNWRASFRLANTAVIKVRWEKEGPFFSGMRLAHLKAEMQSF